MRTLREISDGLDDPSDLESLLELSATDWRKTDEELGSFLGWRPITESDREYVNRKLDEVFQTAPEDVKEILTEEDNFRDTLTEQIISGLYDSKEEILDTVGRLVIEDKTGWQAPVFEREQTLEESLYQNSVGKYFGADIIEENKAQPITEDPESWDPD